MLLGKEAVIKPNADGDMVLRSREAFEDFMELEADVAAFQLTVSG